MTSIMTSVSSISIICILIITIAGWRPPLSRRREGRHFLVLRRFVVAKWAPSLDTWGSAFDAPEAYDAARHLVENSATTGELLSRVAIYALLVLLFTLCHYMVFVFMISCAV